MNESLKDPVRCPKCASTDVRASYTQTTWDLVLDLLFSMDAFRCRSCRKRFHKFDAGGGEEDDREIGKRRRRAEREEDDSRSEV